MTTTEGMEQWDLTSKISPHLDRHMMFPLLEYLDGLISSGTVSYETKDVAAARLALLRPTHMVDYAIDIYKVLHGAESEIPKEMEDQKAGVYKRLEELEKGCKALHELCGNEDERVRYVTLYFYPMHCMTMYPFPMIRYSRSFSSFVFVCFFSLLDNY
jgi:hypothetical protein